MPVVELAQERFLSAIFCTDIDPADPDCFDRLDAELQHIYNGTTGGWKCARPEDCAPINPDHAPWEKVRPVPCGSTPGRWHYVAIT